MPLGIRHPGGKITTTKQKNSFNNGPQKKSVNPYSYHGTSLMKDILTICKLDGLAFQPDFENSGRSHYLILEKM